MSERKISVGLTFDFYPDGEHEELFEGMTEEQIVASAKSMTAEDFDRLVKYNEVWDSLSVVVTSE
jgi:hypothetical protein